MPLPRRSRRPSPSSGRQSYYPGEVQSSPLVKRVLALPDEERRAVVTRLFERVVAMQRREDDCVWHANELLRGALRGRRLSWTLKEVEHLALLAASLRSKAYVLPVHFLLPMVTRVERLTPRLQRSVRALAAEMRRWESAPHQRLAAKLHAPSRRLRLVRTRDRRSAASTLAEYRDDRSRIG